MCVCVCVCVCKREFTVRVVYMCEAECDLHRFITSVRVGASLVCMCARACEREGERERTMLCFNRLYT